MRANFCRSLRTRVSLEEVIARLRMWGGLPEFTVNGDTARVATREVEIELDWSPFDEKRELHCNLRVSVVSDDFGRGWDRTLDELVTRPPPLRAEDHHYLHSRLELEPFCSELQTVFALEPFWFDGENENEWAFSEDDFVIVHVSHAYADDTYHRWHPARCPPGCNYWVHVSVKAAAPPGWDDAWLAGWRERWSAALLPLASGGSGVTLAR
jgi:hypothetical protein